LKASRNAFRYGLSLPMPVDTETSAKSDALARALARDQTDEEHVLAATELAQAQMKLSRIRSVRAELMAQVDLSSGAAAPARGVRPLRAHRPYQAPAGIAQALRLSN